MPSDFERWQKDSPYGVLDGRTDVPPRRIENRTVVSREPTVLRRTKAHLFGVCCIIRTRKLATRESVIIYFVLLPGPWKTSFGNIFTGRRVVGRKFVP